MKIDCHKLGMSMLAAGATLMNLMGSKAAWWIGFAFMSAGPILAAMKPTKGKAR